MEWIKFSDINPRIYSCILITNGKIVCEAYVQDIYENGKVKMTGMRFRGGCDEYLWEDHHGGLPTHWMLMPSPPEVKMDKPPSEDKNALFVKIKVDKKLYKMCDSYFRWEKWNYKQLIESFKNVYK